MNYTINEDVCNKYGMSVQEVMMILLIKSGTDISLLLHDMEKKELIIKNLLNEFSVTPRWDDVTMNILLDSDKERQKPDRLEDLTTKLIEIFPKGKKAGTCHYFRCNKKDVSLKLKKFFKLYGNTYTDEQILNAAKQYVESFNGNYSYMRILKYFIWKDERKINSDGKTYIEETSDLASWIENADQENTSNTEWTAEIR